MAAGIRAGGRAPCSLAAGTLATTIPSAPGHVGTFDWFAAQGLKAYGTSAEVAIAFALTVHAVLWVSDDRRRTVLPARGRHPPAARPRKRPARSGPREGSAPPAFDGGGTVLRVRISCGADS